MPDLVKLKTRACFAIEDKAKALYALGDALLHTPELGYKEYRTAAMVLAEMEALGLENIRRFGGNGIKAWLHGSKPGPRLCIMGELDAVVSPQNPDADPATGAAHACGHNAQLTAMLGAARALKPLREHLCGSVCFFAVPAEEYVEIEWRQSLVKEGKLAYLGGKQQLLHEGAFEDIDLAMMVHSETGPEKAHVVVNGPASGFIGKNVRFIGKEAHAGGAPHEGVNALDAAMLAISAINAHRAAFRDEDRVRVHPILTKGGDLVNIVPADVRMESYVRAASVSAMCQANARVDRAIQGAAYAMGAQAEIENLPGYLPLCQNTDMGHLFAQNAAALLGAGAVEEGLVFAGSTDAGDLSQVLPLIQPTVSGFMGAAHSREFHISDRRLAYLVPAQLLAMTALDLLTGDGSQARAIAGSHKRLSVQEYEQYWKKILRGDV